MREQMIPDLPVSGPAETISIRPVYGNHLLPCPSSLSTICMALSTVLEGQDTQQCKRYSILSVRGISKWIVGRMLTLPTSDWLHAICRELHRDQCQSILLVGASLCFHALRYQRPWCVTRSDPTSSLNELWHVPRTDSTHSWVGDLNLD